MKNEIFNINNFFLILFLFIPIFLITGPALPDIIITFGAIFFLVYYIILKNKYLNILIKWVALNSNS